MAGFVYCRVAPASSSPSIATLVKELAPTGFPVFPNDAVVETVAGSVAMSNRTDWQWLLGRMYEGDTLLVPGLDSLGRDVHDIHATIRLLAEKGVRVRCMALGPMDLASPAGRATMDVLGAVSNFEQMLRAERERLEPGVAKANTPPVKRKGRPHSLTPAQVAEAHKLLAAQVSVVQVANCLGTSRQTIMRVHARDQEGAASRSPLLLPGAR